MSRRIAARLRRGRPARQTGAADAAEALETRLLLTAGPIDTLDAGDSAAWRSRPNGTIAQTFTVAEDAALEAFTVAVRGTGTSGRSSVSAVLAEVSGGGFLGLTPTILARVGTDAAGNAVRVENGAAETELTFDFGGLPGTNLTADTTYAVMLDTQYAAGFGGAVEAGVWAGADPYAGGELYEGDSAAGSQDNLFISFSGQTDLRMRLTFGDPAGPTADRRPGAAASPGGAGYDIAEGDALALDGSASTDEDPAALTYAWDLDADGVYDDAAGATPTLSWADLRGIADFDGGFGGFTSLKEYAVGLRVTDAAGQTAHSLTTLRIEDTPPALADSVTDVTADATGSVVLNLAATDPGEDPIVSWQVNWGDGTVTTYAGEAPTATHAYAEEGVYTVSLAAKEPTGGGYGGRLYGLGSIEATVNEVGDPVPQISASLDRDLYFEDFAEVRLTFSATDPGGDPVTDWLIEWGDGTTSTATGQSGELSHTYADDGLYAIALTATNGAGPIAAAGPIADVRRVAPRVDIVGTSFTNRIAEGFGWNLSAFVLDAPAETFTYAWTLTDPAGATVAGTDSAIRFDAPDDGRYVLSVTVTDDDGLSTTATEIVTAFDLPPEIALTQLDGVPGIVDEGTPAAFALTHSDPGDDTPVSYTIDWGDGTELTVSAANLAAAGGIVTHAYADNGFYEVLVAVTDEEGTQSVRPDIHRNFSNPQFDNYLTARNLDPTAAIVGLPDGAVGEGETVTLSAVASDPAGDLDPLTYAWAVFDADGGEVAAGTGAEFTFTAGDEGAFTVALLVADDDGGDVEVGGALTFENLAPAVAAFDATAVVLRGREARVSGAVTDPGVLDELTATIDWGDGTVETVALAADGSFAATHAYTGNSGDYAVTLNAADGDGGTATATAAVSVTAAAVLADPLYGGAALFVVGTAGDDVLTVRRNAAGETVVRESGETVGRFDPASFGRIVIDGGDGHDFLSVSVTVSAAAWIDGGAGNDYLRGGSGADVIDGGAGHDLLAGRGGSDVLIGGTGGDWIFGNADEDILIAGTVDLTHPTAGFASDDDGLKFVADSWSGSGSLFDRFEQIAPVLERGETVLDDDAADVMVGGQGVDWFFGEQGRDAVFDNPFQSIFNDDLDWILDWT